MMLRPQSLLLTLGHLSAKHPIARLTTPIILRQISSSRMAAGGSMLARRMLSSAGHDHSSDLKHFENYRNQDAIPFGVDNKFWWAFKLSLVSVVGLGAPIFIVYWQM